MSVSIITEKRLHEITDGYIEAALWTERDDEPDGDNPDGVALEDNYGKDDLAPKTWEQIYGQVKEFVSANDDDVVAFAHLQGSYGHVGHDLWLTRNGHGAGFWDRGYGKLGDRLTEGAKSLGEQSLYVGDDGKLYAFPGEA